MRALVIDADAANRLAIQGGLSEDWLSSLAPPGGGHRVEHGHFTYIIGSRSSVDPRLLVIRAAPAGILDEVPRPYRLESFHRVLRAALSQFRPGFAKIPLEWRVFHSGSLVSFQTNRIHTKVTSRAYMDVAPEGTEHIYLFWISRAPGEPLDRANYDAELFVEAVLNYEDATKLIGSQHHSTAGDIGHLTVDLERQFSDANIALGIPFSIWRDAKLTRRQREFFDAPFNGPLRVKGPAGAGKTLVLTMRFLREVYAAVDDDRVFRACFLAHGEETADMISKYLLQIDERGIILEPMRYPKLDLEITTLHGLANRYINRDTENIQPLSLDGSEGRTLQFELIESLAREFVRSDWAIYKEGCRPEFVRGIEASPPESEHRAFCYDLSDEFANVLEAFGVRAIDDIGHRYTHARPSERALARNPAEKRVVLELYRRFRGQLAEMGVVSLDQFTADFLAYLNSFRWDALRRDKGFDCAFVDELHLFNAQERRVLGYLLRNPEPPRRVAVAYDPRQSPRNSFFPEASTERDTVWSEAGLDSQTKPFELNDVFRYTPQILAVLDRLNQWFPATDLAEDWALRFGRSQVADGPVPQAQEHKSQVVMVEEVARRAKAFAARMNTGEHVAVLCLDYDRFGKYQVAGLFRDFVVVAGRDELGLIGRFHKRPILSMPEYVAGLQFKAVLIIDTNANLVAELGGGPNGLHRFISSVYLGASRAKHLLEIHSDLTAGGHAEPVKDVLDRLLVEKIQARH